MKFELHSSIRKILLLWFGWSLIILVFQSTLGLRLHIQPPDRALFWTASETMPGSQSAKIYLNEPFLNSQVSWDSEYYLSIAARGYNDPAVAGIGPGFRWGAGAPAFCLPGDDSACISRSYAFFPVYPLLIRILAIPLGFLPLNTIAALSLAALLVSLSGTLVAILSLHFLSLPFLGEDGAMRAVFYFLIFPTSFFLAQVYTEGFFIGLTFGCLALLLERRWLPAAILACLAAWTRPGGAILLLPMAVLWLRDRSWTLGWKRSLGTLLAVLSPALSFGVWMLTPLSRNFFFVEQRFFGRGLFALQQSLDAWGMGWNNLLAGDPQARYYYALEFAGIALAALACFILFRHSPELSLFGLAMLVFSLTSGAAQGMLRYVLVVPPLFLVLARWGRHPVFDRLWSLASILLLTVETMLFTFDFWVA
jgi:hypothetical protein